jgi:hypothetical protein
MEKSVSLFASSLCLLVPPRAPDAQATIADEKEPKTVQP